MTTPGGVPNLPPGALTLDTLAAQTQDMSTTAMKTRAAGRFSSIFNTSTGLSPASSFTPFGILTGLFSGFNSSVANADPTDVDGPEDLPGLLISFIESLPVIGQFIELFQAILGDYTGTDTTLLGIQTLFAPIRAIVDAITGITGGTGGIADFFNLGGSTSIFGAITNSITNFAQTIFQGLTGGLFGGSGGFGGLMSGVQTALQNINPLNVNGVGGPANIVTTVTTFLNQLVGGFVGSVGSGAGFADVFNVGQQVSSNSTLGKFSWDILGIRNNKSLNSGFLPTSSSNITLDKVALQTTAPTVAVTKTTALTTYHRLSESMTLGAVSWQGYGTTNITNAYVNVYKMNTTTGDNTLLHGSADIVGSLTGGTTPVPVVYSLPSAITGLTAGDVIGTEIIVRGTGTHNVAGTTTWLTDQTVYPRRFSSVRDSSSTLAPSTVTPTYTSSVPFVEIAVSSSDVAIPHTPQTNLFNTAGSSSIPIPSWCNYVDTIVLGAGGAGHVGGTWGVSGKGGSEGSWSTGTWSRGSDFTGTPSVTVTVGSGGAGGFGNGGNGSSSSAAITGHTVTGNGGAGATAFGVVGSDSFGHSPGNLTYNSVTYVGGGQQNTLGGIGAAPGGGGAGGNYVSFQPGGNGAVGTVWIVFRT